MAQLKQRVEPAVRLARAGLPGRILGRLIHVSFLDRTVILAGQAFSAILPLIMVVTFVGFVGGYVQALFGPDRAWLAGMAAAGVVTWFTFLPSFVFVLAGGPLVESARDDVAFVAPLAAITAAVVGVILHLAAFFGGHVLWPAGLSGPFDLRALVIALVAAIALFRFDRHVVEVIVACALFGALFGRG